MAKRKIEICTKCGKEECDGIEYVVPYRDFQLGRNEVGIVCTSQTELKNGTRVYEIVFGHGNKAKFVAFPIPEPVEIK